MIDKSRVRTKLSLLKRLVKHKYNTQSKLNTGRSTSPLSMPTIGAAPVAGPTTTTMANYMTATVVIPLPLTRSKQAPKFKGKKVGDFTAKLEIMAKNAGLSNTELLKLVRVYSAS